MSICGVSESDEEGSPCDERIKLEATLTEDIDIKMEEHDTSESNLTNVFIHAGDDFDVNIKAEDVADHQLYPPEADDGTDDGEGSELEKKDNQGAAAKNRKLTTPTSELSSSKHKKSGSVEIRKKEELLPSKSHKTNRVIVTGTISEDKILDKIEHTTELQKNISTSYDVTKKFIVCSDANIKPSHRDLCTKTNLKTHIHIPATGKRYICDTCNKQVSVKSNLVRHLHTHTKEKPFSCNICNFRCHRKSVLVKHLRRHTGKKRFTCNTCNYRCNRRIALVTHLRTHTGEKPFSCNICNYRCSQKINLVTHLRTHTGEKPFTCNICNYRFNHKSALVRHLRTHTGEKPFSCNICNYRCNEKGDLVKHLRTHTGEKPFSCDTCNKRFTRSSHLKSHIRTHTNRI